jgi:hypothetical protein
MSFNSFSWATIDRYDFEHCPRPEKEYLLYISVLSPTYISSDPAFICAAADDSELTGDSSFIGFDSLPSEKLPTPEHYNMASTTPRPGEYSWGEKPG